MREPLIAIASRLRAGSLRARSASSRPFGIAAATGATFLGTLLVLALASGPGMAARGAESSPSAAPAGRGTTDISQATGRPTPAMDAAQGSGTPMILPGTPPPAGSTPDTGCTRSTLASCPIVPAPSPLPPDASGRPASALRVPILEYHRVRPAAGESGFAEGLITPPEIFEQQMKALSQAGWTAITMGQLGDDLRLGIRPAPRSFVITFDDGYEDGWINALPILKRNGFVATFFVIASRIGEPGFLTPAELRGLVLAGNEIGNHSWSHQDLEVKTPEQLVQETTGASALISRYTGTWPQSFSYPMGLRDPRVVAAVAATPGIETAVVQEETRTESWSNRLELPRIRVGPGTTSQDLLDRVGRYQP